MAIRTTILRRASVLGDYKFEGSFAHRGGGPLRTGGKGGRASITQVPNCLLVFRTAGGWAGQRKVGWGVGGGLDYKKSPAAPDSPPRRPFACSGPAATPFPPCFTGTCPISSSYCPSLALHVTSPLSPLALPPPAVVATFFD